MSLLFMDGFDHYDGVIGNLTSGTYLQRTGWTLSTAKPRNGTHSLLATSASDLAVAIPVARQVVGCGHAFWQSAPIDASTPLFAFLRDNGNLSGTQYNVAIVLQANGSISAYNSSYVGTLLGSSNPGVIVYGAWNHVEVRCLCSQTVGQVQIRVNGVEVLNLTNVDTTYSSAAEVSSGIKFELVTGGVSRYMDDVFIWDDQGSTNNTFIGDKRVTILDPDNNTAVAEWTVVGAASPVQAINTTNDGDTSYITASDSVPVTSEFELANPDSSVGQIAGVQTVFVAKKVLSGTAIIEPSLVVSSSATSNGSHSVTDAYAYYNKIHELNPNTGMPWTNSTLATAKLRLRRTT